MNRNRKVREMDCGIYTITSPSGGQYVGSALSFERRWRDHRSDLRCGKHHNEPLQKAFIKYGESGLVFTKLLCCAPQDLLMYEQMAIDTLDPKYNICRIAGSPLGVKHSPETNAKNSARQKGRPGYNKGKTYSEETRKNMSLARRGIPIGPLPEAHRANISAKRGTSGFRGVSFDRRLGRWKAQITVNGKSKHVGNFDTPELAQAAWRLAYAAQSAPTT